MSARKADTYRAAKRNAWRNEKPSIGSIRRERERLLKAQRARTAAQIH